MLLVAVLPLIVNAGGSTEEDGAEFLSSPDPGTLLLACLDTNSVLARASCQRFKDITLKRNLLKENYF